jgi:methionyl-tRNA formyltransferase
VACKDGFISILNIQAEGKTKMNIDDFLRGFRIADHSIPVS